MSAMRQTPITLDAAQRRQPGVAVPSPCVSVCRLDEASGLCVGCHRTLAEIGAWSRMSDEAMRQVWLLIQQRLSGMGEAA